MATKALTVALLGAESTGKSQLALALADHFSALGSRAQAIGEVLREWCDREGRTPRPDEQIAIAVEQARRIANAAAHASIVIADTTPLMTAIYSDLLFADRSIYTMALEHQRGFDLTLVTGLDLPWIADGLQRDGPQVREPVDSKIRTALDGAGIAYKVVYGTGPARLRNALHAMQFVAKNVPCTSWNGILDSQNKAETAALACANCGDPACERRLFSRLL